MLWSTFLLVVSCTASYNRPPRPPFLKENGNYLRNDLKPSHSSMFTMPIEELWGKNKKKFSNQFVDFVEAHFQESVYDPECWNREKIELVYYSPDEATSEFYSNNLELECKMCDISYLFDGKPKRWAKFSSVLDFFQNKDRFNSRSKIEYLENLSFIEDWMNNRNNENPMNCQTINRNRKYTASYRQINHKLLIQNADVNSAGVYFCYDEYSQFFSQFHFYILIPMVPPKAVHSINALTPIYANQHYIHKFYNTRCNSSVDARKDAWCFLPGSKWSTCVDPFTKCSLRVLKDVIPSQAEFYLDIVWSDWIGNKRLGEVVLRAKPGLKASLEKLQATQLMETFKSYTTFETAQTDFKGIKLFSSLTFDIMMWSDFRKMCNIGSNNANIKIYRDIMKSIHRVNGNIWKYFFSKKSNNGVETIRGAAIMLIDK